MTVDEMWKLYCRVMFWEIATWNGTWDAPFTLRVWDGMDGCWCDVVAKVDLETALRTWCERTSNGTKNTNFHDIDYYQIFPASVHMLWSGDFTMRGDENSDENDDETDR